MEHFIGIDQEVSHGKDKAAREYDQRPRLSADELGAERQRRQRCAAARGRAALRHGPRPTAHGYALVGEFYDAAVSGADPIETRPGFAAMLERIEADGVRVVLVEDASRFARSVIAQELGVLAMQSRGVRVLTAGGDDLTRSDDPAKVMMRQIAGAFAQYEKARLVAKLKGARDRRSVALGRRIEGRKGYAELAPDLVREAKRLARCNPRTGERRSLRAIARELERLGYVNGKGRAFAAAQVSRLMAG